MGTKKIELATLTDANGKSCGVEVKRSKSKTQDLIERCAALQHCIEDLTLQLSNLDKKVTLAQDTQKLFNARVEEYLTLKFAGVVTTENLVQTIVDLDETGNLEHQEVLESWQLPLDASETMMRRASLEQVRDLLHRRRDVAGLGQNIGRGPKHARTMGQSEETFRLATRSFHGVSRDALMDEKKNPDE